MIAPVVIMARTAASFRSLNIACLRLQNKLVVDRAS
jgi:hypothetical protein